MDRPRCLENPNSTRRKLLTSNRESTGLEDSFAPIYPTPRRGANILCAYGAARNGNCWPMQALTRSNCPESSGARLSAIQRRIRVAARAIWLRARTRRQRSGIESSSCRFIKVGGVTVSTGSIAARETCRGVGTRNRLQNKSCQR